MELIINNIRIRDTQVSDAELLQKWWNDGSVMACVGFPNGLAISREKIIEKIQNESEETIRRQMIEMDGKAIGEMDYRNQGDGVVEIDIKICEADYQNRGLGKIILSHYCQEMFKRGYREIVLDTDLENKRAQHVYEAIGFEKTGISENSWTDQLGRLRSSVDYRMLPQQLKHFE